MKFAEITSMSLDVQSPWPTLRFYCESMASTGCQPDRRVRVTDRGLLENLLPDGRWLDIMASMDL